MKKIIESKNAPKAIGPYSPGIMVKGIKKMLILAGQIPLDPQSGEMVGGGIQEQTRRVMLNIKGLLEEAGMGFNNVVKTTVFLTDLGNFASFNEVYKEYFDSDYPARTTIEVKGLPRGAMIEIEVIAVET